MRSPTKHALTLALILLVPGCDLCAQKPVKNSADGGTATSDGGGCTTGCTGPLACAPDVPPAGTCDATQASASSVCDVSDSDSTLPQALQMAAAATSGNFVYVAGGTNSTDTAGYRSVEVATIGENGAVGNFTSTTQLPAPIAYSTLVSWNGYLYLVGGAEPGTNYDTVMATVYYAQVGSDGTIASWQTGNPLPSARKGGGAVALNGFLYSLGGNPAASNGQGQGDATASSTSPVYFAPIQSDGSVGTWQATTSLPQGRVYLSAAATGKYIYVVGGEYHGFSGSPCDANTVLVGEVNTDGSVKCWAPVTSFTSNSVNGGAAIIGNQLVVVVGVTTNSTYGSPYVLSAALDSNGAIGSEWLLVGYLPETAFGRALAATSSSIYLFGGNAQVNDSTALLDSVETVSFTSSGAVSCP